MIMMLNMERPVVGEEEPYPYHCGEDTEGAKNGLCWCDAGTSFARSRASMATLNEEVMSRPFDNWDVAAIVKTQCGDEKTVLREAVKRGLGLD